MTDSQLRWEEFDKFHAIKRLREIVGKWWKIQINYTDSKGYLRGVSAGKFFNPLNPICTTIVGSEKGFNSCRDTARQTTVDMNSLKISKTGGCHAGFSTLSVPIRVNNQFLGTVFGDGFIMEETAPAQRAKIKNYLERFFPENEKDLLAKIDELPVLSKKEVEYLTELIHLVVEEIVSSQKNLYETNDRLNELSKELNNRYGFDQMIGKSAPMQSMYRLLERVSKSDSTVLVQGENGTGKELIAKALHHNSHRKNKKFIVINCGAFNENLLESELFGHAKGSFTGAIKDKKGLFEEAHGGTLFLDEIGDTSMTMQVKLLRVLQEGSFTPVGTTQVKSADVRILAATNRDLAGMVKSGQFREDLYYRLNVINVTVPPLRTRKEDIVILSDHFLQQNVKQLKKPLKNISKACLEKLINYDWPGNVRELENEIERLCVLAGDDPDLQADYLSPRILESSGNKFPGYRVDGRLKDALEDLEKQMIQEGLEKFRYNRSRLAKELGISRAGLIMKIDKYGLDKRGVS